MRFIVRFPTILLLIIAITIGSAGVLPTPVLASKADDFLSDGLSDRDRIEVFDEVWETIQEKYYDAAFNGVDWRAVRDKYRPQIEHVANDDDFYDLLKRMVGELHDAHTRFHTPEQRHERVRLQAVSAGVSIFEVEGKVVIAGVEADSDASRAGVLEGMPVIAIDGKPVADRIEEVRTHVAGTSSDRAVRLRLYRMIIDGDPGTTLKLTLARFDGSQFDVSLTRRIVADTAVVTSRRLASGIGLIKLTLWKSPIRKQFKKALEQFRDAPGVVLDLRGNPGGEADEVVKIASYFFNAHVPFGRFSRRSGKAIYLRTDDDDRIYKGPVAILINEGSGSGSELFAGVMQENGRAVIVGRRSCGCVLGISEFKRVKGGGELAVSEYGYLSPRENSFEGTGVKPDRPVELRLSDLQARRDTALEEAESVLLSKPSTKIGVSQSAHVSPQSSPR